MFFRSIFVIFALLCSPIGLLAEEAVSEPALEEVPVVVADSESPSVSEDAVVVEAAAEVDVEEPAAELTVEPVLEKPVVESHNYVQTRLVAERQGISAGEVVWVGLLMDMPEGWHTYWQNPGDSGLQTQIKWTLPDGFEASSIVWPAPQRFETEQIVSYGYSKQVLLLTKILPPKKLRPGTDVTLNATATWLACKDVCIPEKAELTLELPVLAKQAEKDPEWSSLFLATQTQLPSNVLPWDVDASFKGNRLFLRLIPHKGGQLPESAYFFPYGNELIVHSHPQIFKRNADSIELELELLAEASSETVPVQGLLALNTRNFFRLNVEARPIVDEPTVVVEAPAYQLLFAVIFAFIGGLILNLMPCVLPVLSLKILGFVKQSGAKRWVTFKHGLLFVGGVLLSFWLLVGLLLVLRSAGEQVGWGFQLQSPWFVVALIVFFTGFALNLFGLFEMGTSLSRFGQYSSGQSSAWSSFFSGVLATIVATPCSAPFMGSALGFALAQPAYVVWLIFTSLALGMSFPYLMLSANPSWLRWVPRPGAWMGSFKQFMAFPLLATVLWLLWVLALQTDMTVVWRVLWSLLGLSMALWLYGLSFGKPIYKIVSVALLFFFVLRAFSATSVVKGNSEWLPYTAQKVAEYQAEGRTVFLDFTAAWCLSCQVNKKTSLSNERVLKAFAQKKVVTMRADWTNKNPQITEALASYGRSGVPLYVLLKPGAKPVLLPEVLTPQIVLNALDELEE